MYPVTDIIVLTHNQLQITKGFIEHLFKNTNNFNLIFVDNKSTDGTRDFLTTGEKENRWKAVLCDTNLGIIKGRNLGATHIQSDFFLNIDNDQYPGPNWLENLHNLMNTGKDVVGCEAWKLLKPNTKGVITIAKENVGRCYFPYQRCTNPKDSFTYIGCGGMLIKRKVYEKIGLFDESFSPAYFEDPDFSFRAIQSGFKLGWAHNASIMHLAHQTIEKQSLFNKNEQFLKSFKLFKKKWYPYFPPE